MKKCIVCIVCSCFIFFLGLVFGVWSNLTVFQPVTENAVRDGNALHIIYKRNPYVGILGVKRSLKLALSEDFWVDSCGYGGYSTPKRQKEMRGVKRNFEPKQKT